MSIKNSLNARLKTRRDSCFLTLLSVLILVLALNPSPSLARKKAPKSDKKAPKRAGSQFYVSPPMFDLSCEPGQKKTITLRVGNPERYPSDVSLVVEGLVAGPDGLKRQPLLSLPPNNLARHVVIQSPKITVPPKSYKDVSVTLNVPEGLSGTQYVSLTASNVSPYILQELEVDVERRDEFESQVGVGMRPAIGIRIKCDIVGTMKYAYSLKTLEVRPARGNQPLKIVATIKNNGNGEMIVRPIMILMDEQRNKPVARLKSEGIVKLMPFGMSQVAFSAPFAQIPSGRYRAVLSIPDPKYNLTPTEKTIVIH